MQSQIEIDLAIVEAGVSPECNGAASDVAT